MSLYNIRKFLTYWKVVHSLLNQNNQNMSLLNNTDQDQRDLALGRWTQFKQVFVPHFTVGMDSDQESLLLQYCLRTAHGMRTGGVVTTYRPNGLDNLEATKLAIEIVKECQFSGILLADKLKLLMETKNA